MALFKAQLTWSQFKRGEIVEIDDENRGPFERAIARGWLQPYTEDDVLPPLYIDGQEITPVDDETLDDEPVDVVPAPDEAVGPPDEDPQG